MNAKPDPTDPEKVLFRRLSKYEEVIQDQSVVADFTCWHRFNNREFYPANIEEGSNVLQARASSKSGRRKEAGSSPPPAPSLEINISTLGVIATILGTILGILRAIIEIIKLFKKSPAVPADP